MSTLPDLLSKVIQQTIMDEMLKPLPFCELFLVGDKHAKAEWKKLSLWRRLFTNKRRFLRAEAKKYQDAQPAQYIQIRKTMPYRKRGAL